MHPCWLLPRAREQLVRNAFEADEVSGELEVVEIYRDAGVKAQRNLEESRTHHSRAGGDVLTPSIPVVNQVKIGQRPSWRAAYDQAEAACDPKDTDRFDLFPCAWTRRDREEWIVHIPGELYSEMVRLLVHHGIWRGK